MVWPSLYMDVRECEVRRWHSWVMEVPRISVGEAMRRVATDCLAGRLRSGTSSSREPLGICFTLVAFFACSQFHASLHEFWGDVSCGCCKLISLSGGGRFRTPGDPPPPRDDLIGNECDYRVVLHDYIITWSVMTIRLMMKGDLGRPATQSPGFSLGCVLIAGGVVVVSFVFARMSATPTGAHAKSAGAVTEPINMETIVREISRTLQALFGQIARLEHLHTRKITAGMQTLSNQITRVHDRLDS
eukprot:6491627-Amphidinium_carterae.1